MLQSRTERAVRKAIFDEYGRSMVKEILRSDHDCWQIELHDGGISMACIMDDGSILIEALRA